MYDLSYKDINISLRQVLQVIQKHTEIQEQIQILAQQAREENERRAKEIKLLKQAVAEIKLVLTNKKIIKSKNSKSVRKTTKKTVKSRKKDRIPAASIPETTFDPKSDNNGGDQYHNEQQHQIMLSAEDAIRFIPTLNGDDDVGVEEFIKEVHAMRMCCSQKDLLLKAIKIDKIVGKAARSIRHIPIGNYEDLYNTLRSNVVVDLTSDEYEEQLRDLKQGRHESVQSFNIRFRCILNRLTYAIISENLQPITRRIMIEATMRKVSRIYLKGLRRDIGRILLAGKLDSLYKTEKKAVDVERYLQEEEKGWRTGSRPTASDRPLPTTRNNNPVNKRVSPVSKTERVSSAKRQVRCPKCDELGHVEKNVR
ncbi:uncharacterized protein LOC143304055 [Bombus vancouverensis nearcticus]|uniref:uncharacterized protein LOC143304055 n=1 Tax=Bombus vancouverensis nearcticus TaxID=2705178 RepID=UPI00402B9E1A